MWCPALGASFGHANRAVVGSPNERGQLDPYRLPSPRSPRLGGLTELPLTSSQPAGACCVRGSGGLSPPGTTACNAWQLDRRYETMTTGELLERRRNHSQSGFELLCACLAASSPDSPALAERLAAHDDWPGFLAQLQWHRVTSQIWPVIEAQQQHVPAATVGFILEHRRRQLMQAMNHTAELHRLNGAFRQQRIDYLVLKGQPLSQQLYGSPYARFSKDIDLLVHESSIGAAHSLLLSLGYERVVPGPDAPAHVMDVYTRFRKEFIYWHPESRVEVELHWRLEGNPHFLPMWELQPFEDSREVLVKGVALPVMSESKQCVYLLMHITTSSWARLSWLSDILRLVRGPMDLVDLRQRADGFGLGASLQVTLNLLARYFQVSVPEGPKPSPRVRLLTASARRCLTHNRYPAGVVLPFQRLLACPRPGFLSYDLRWRVALSINDVAVVSLPRSLFVLYYPLRPILWLLRWLPYTGVNKLQT
jgi:hypothetical protein